MTRNREGGLAGIVVALALLIAGAAVGCATIAGIDAPTARPVTDASSDATNESQPGDGQDASGDVSEGTADVAIDAGQDSGCGPSTCANGCCNGSTCVPYTLQGATGGGGVNCGTCSGGCCAHLNANKADSGIGEAFIGLGQAFYDCEPICDAVDNGGPGTNCTPQGARDACDAYLASLGGGTCTQNAVFYIYGTPTCPATTWAYYPYDASSAGQVWQNQAGQCYSAYLGNTHVYWQ